MHTCDATQTQKLEQNIAAYFISDEKTMIFIDTLEQIHSLTNTILSPSVYTSK